VRDRAAAATVAAVRVFEARATAAIVAAVRVFEARATVVADVRARRSAHKE